MLETKDLVLDKAKFADWEGMYRNVWSHPECFRYMVLEVTTNEADARDRARRSQAFQKDHDAWFVYRKADGEPIGFAGVNQLEPGVWTETGICLGPAYVGKGYGSQVLECLLQYAKERGAKVFLYSSWEGNQASRALAEKMGFRYDASEEMTREHDGLRYTLLKYKLEL